MAYCTTDDLLLGDMPISSSISPTNFIDDSADEIDVRIGRIYLTPVVLADTSANRVARLTLKIANARLASGRMLMAQAQAAQDESLHAYAMYLIGEADATIQAIQDNRLPLDNAEIREDLPDPLAPSINNHDASSPVESFYSTFMTGGPYGIPTPDTRPIWQPGP